MKYSKFNTPTFKEFYATELFSDIKNYIGRNQKDYRVVSTALHPTIAQYNGFYTLDTYNNTIPIEYKHNFRKIIAPELNKNKQLKNYRYTWRNRLYMSIDQPGKHYMLAQNSENTIEKLGITRDAIKNLGGEYVLSGLPIENHNAPGLQFEEPFEHPGTHWKIFLYRVK